jgi:SAM-dependent methyltransferase
MTAPSFDPIWREKYAQGLEIRAPYDCIVSFVFRNRPKKARSEIRILEVGCGTGNNVWYLSREGFSVSGIDGSPEAISYASQRLKEDRLAADLRVGDFTQLPFPENTFDLVYDRGSLTCCGLSSAKRAVQEIYRVLVHGGKFFFNPYSAEHTSAKSGQQLEDNLTVNIDRGNLVGCGQLCFYNRAEVEGLLREPWKVESLSHLHISELLGQTADIHAEWRVVARK